MTQLSAFDRVLLRRRHNRRRLRLQLIFIGTIVLVLTLSFHRKNSPQPEGNWPSLEQHHDSGSISENLNTSSTTSNTTAWSEIQERLCPRHIPEIDYADLLFELARKEIDETPHSSITARSEERIHQFFSGPFDRGTKLCRMKENKKNFILYMRIYKCANNQITEWMNDAMDECYSKTDLQESLELFYSAAPEKSSSLCAVTAIRDPISHFLSAYNEVEYQWMANHSNFANSEVKQKLLQNQDLSYLHTDSKEERFKQFVTDFILHPNAMRQGAFDHLDLMSRILPTLAEQGISLTGYLPSLDNLTSAWPQFVQSTCHSEDLFKEMAVSAQHESSEDPFGTYQAAQNTWRQEGPIAKALCILHVMDYACWDKLEIPQFCQEQVYDTESFMNAIVDNPRRSKFL